jgi:hypothetical protein
VVEAKYDTARCCLLDTRKDIIGTIIDWVSKNEDDTKVFWLHGLAGMGKSTIAISVSRDLSARQWLGGTFFFSRDVVSRSKPDQLFSTIAFQMASNNPSIASAICGALYQVLDIGQSAVVNQFEGLIKNTLCGLKDIGHPLINALDECGCEKQRKDLLTIIRTGFTTLPRFVKFIVTSRPEADIRTMFTSTGPLVQPFNLSTIQSTLVEADVFTFIRARMTAIAELYELATDDWPGRERCCVLAQRAAGLFVWASTVCDFIEDDQNDGPEAQLSLILSGPNTTSSSAFPWVALDNLYLQVLRQSIPANAPISHVDKLCRVVGTIVAAADPLSPLDLAQLLGLHGSSSGSHDNMQIRDILRKLHSLLIVPPADNETLRVIHPSFVDFITDPKRCNDNRFFIDLPGHRLHLAKRCLMRMQECLQRDICQLGIGPIMNHDIPDFEKCITESIPGDMQYACRFWAEHLHRCVIDEELYALVHRFIFEHLLHWFEVMSLMGMYDNICALLTLAQASLKVISSLL